MRLIDADVLVSENVTIGITAPTAAQRWMKENKYVL